MFIEPIKTLTNLQQVFVDGNMLHDIKIVRNLQNLNWKIIQPFAPQKVAAQQDYEQSGFSEEKILESIKIMKVNEKDNEQFIHDAKMGVEFKQLVQGKSVKIRNCQDLKSILFTDYFNMATVRLSDLNSILTLKQNITLLLNLSKFENQKVTNMIYIEIQQGFCGIFKN
ncbi:Hypothetical_protein [Hexamita inflata]|uniref:Hypothetical_protein n=1 Tax=Hexamita inflata TaxID=28002 RepID=A0AA86QR45_9EUKA|nr:Hypothetical protein HINF_LOCUS52116 [Hexamita inflata]